MAPIVTEKGTYIAPFVNAEAPQYLVVEDRFPNGRPALEAAGVYMTDRETVNRTERMKVTTCLNPLHTGLAIFGCLLGYSLIADEMRDADLKALAERIGYTEGLPVVTDPGILSPKAFLDEVVKQRLPNPFLPDTPQRIATDTSQKLPIRFGETLKSYAARPDLDIPPDGDSADAGGGLRYLLGIDDEGREMPVAPIPCCRSWHAALADVRFGHPDTAGSVLDPLLENAALFGVNLRELGLLPGSKPTLRKCCPAMEPSGVPCKSIFIHNHEQTEEPNVERPNENCAKPGRTMRARSQREHHSSESGPRQHAQRKRAGTAAGAEPHSRPGGSSGAQQGKAGGNLSPAGKRRFTD